LTPKIKNPKGSLATLQVNYKKDKLGLTLTSPELTVFTGGQQEQTAIRFSGNKK
jgi:hypothetical protein